MRIRSLGWFLAMISAVAEVPGKTRYSTKALPDLFKRFAEKMNIHFPPPRDAGEDPVVVKIDISFHSLVRIISKEESVEMSVWYHLYWNDERLAYNGSHEFGSGWNSDGDYIAMPPDMIWKPDIVPYYPALEDNEKHTFASNVYAYLFDSEFLKANGYNIHWVRPANLNFRCGMEMENFPWDSHVCDLIVGPWHAKAANHRFFHANLLAYGDESRLNSEEWEVKLLNTEEVKNEYNTGVYEEVHLTLQFTRYPHYYVVNIILPMLLTVVAANLTLLLPIHSGPGERMAFASTLVLTIMATMLFTAELRPSSNTDTWLDRFQGWCLFFTFLPMLESCIITLPQHADDMIKSIKNLIDKSTKLQVIQKIIQHCKICKVRHLDRGFAQLYAWTFTIVMGSLYNEMPRGILSFTRSEIVLVVPAIATIVPFILFLLFVIALKAAGGTRNRATRENGTMSTCTGSLSIDVCAVGVSSRKLEICSNCNELVETAGEISSLSPPRSRSSKNGTMSRDEAQVLTDL